MEWSAGISAENGAQASGMDGMLWEQGSSVKSMLITQRKNIINYGN